MSKNINRKKFLKNSLMYAVGATAGIAGLSALGNDDIYASEEKVKHPFIYKKQNPEEGRILAHDTYYKGGCGYAGFHGVVKLLQDNVGGAYNGIPTKLMSFSGGGIKGWGTICGALNGACAAINLSFNGKDSGKIINELMSWYCNTALPTDVSNKLAEDKKFEVDKGFAALTQNVSNSPLCHASVTGWCNVSGNTVHSPEQKERCARLSGDTVAKAIELMNNVADNKFEAEYVPADEIKKCNSCHGYKKDVENVASKMNCTSCHEPHPIE